MNDPNISLRPFASSDADSMIDLLLDEQVKKTYMVPDFASREAAKPLFDRLLELSHSENRFVRAISVEGKAVGMINDVGISGREIELGYALLPAHWGRGYATEALKAAMENLFAAGFETVKAYNEKTGENFAITAVWAEKDKEGGVSTDEFCARYGVKKCATIAELASEVDYFIILSPDNSEKKLEYAKEAFLINLSNMVRKPLRE